MPERCTVPVRNETKFRSQNFDMSAQWLIGDGIGGSRREQWARERAGARLTPFSCLREEEAYIEKVGVDSLENDDNREEKNEPQCRVLNDGAGVLFRTDGVGGHPHKAAISYA